MDPPNDSRWSQISPGHFQLPHDSISSFFQDTLKNNTKAGRQSFMIATHCRVRFSVDQDEFEAKLRKAWRTMRHYSPAIACEWHEHHRSYKVPTDVGLARWMRESFQTPSTTLEETFGMVRDQFQPVLYFLRKGNDKHHADILLACNHAVSDARGSYYFLDALFKAVGDPQEVNSGDEIQHLPPSRDELLGLPPFPGMVGWMKGVELVRSNFAPGPKNIALPQKSASQTVNLPGGSVRNATLSEEETQRLVSSCHKLGISVTAATKAALMMASRTHDSPDKEVFTAFDFYDTRPFMPGSPKTNHNMGQYYCALLPSQHDLGDKSFSEVAREVHAHFQKLRSEMKDDPQGVDAVAHITKEMFSGDVPPTPVLSSIGVVDNYMSSKYGHGIEIESTVTAVPANGASKHNAWFASSFKGRFQLAVSFSPEFYEQRLIDSIMTETFRLLLTEACGMDAEQADTEVDKRLDFTGSISCFLESRTLDAKSDSYVDTVDLVSMQQYSQ